MESTMKYSAAGTENIPIRCRNRINWFRVIILTLAYTLIGWLAFGLFCTLVDGTITFWSALVTPLALIFLAFDLVSCFISNRDQSAGNSPS